MTANPFHTLPFEEDQGSGLSAGIVLSRTHAYRVN
jgi:hypothetical protein